MTLHVIGSSGFYSPVCERPGESYAIDSIYFFFIMSIEVAAFTCTHAWLDQNGTYACSDVSVTNNTKHEKSQVEVNLPVKGGQTSDGPPGGTTSRDQLLDHLTLAQYCVTTSTCFLTTIFPSNLHPPAIVVRFGFRRASCCESRSSTLGF